MIGILDYGVGNLLNLKNSFDFLKMESRIIRGSEDLEKCKRVMLPGVGAFAPAMKNLRKSGMLEILEKKVLAGMPLLGICLGAQLLLDESSEDGKFPGLGWIPGKVRRFEHGLKIPQIGWNRVFVKSRDPLFDRIPSESYFYFVHSYFMQPNSKASVLGTTSYGQVFASVVNKDHIWGVQFHPEKSQQVGLTLLKNFSNIKLGNC